MGLLDVPVPAIARQTEIYFDPATRPDGAVNPGGTFSLFASPSSPSPLQISGGLIQHTPFAGAQSAGYLQIQLAARVRRMGAMVAWPANAVGAVTLVMPVSAWSSGNVTGAAVHLTLYGNGIWSLTRITPNGGGGITSTTIADNTTHGRYETVWDNTLRRVEMYLDVARSRLRILFPDGTQTIVESAFFATETTNLAIWELFENNGATDVPAKIGAIWADSYTQAPGGRPSPSEDSIAQVETPAAIFNVSGTMLIDGFRANTFVATLVGNVTTLYFSNLKPSQIIEIHFVQDATGGRTLSGVNANIKLAGGALTLTTTAGRRDIVRFRNVRGTLYEIGRSMNVG